MDALNQVTIGFHRNPVLARRHLTGRSKVRIGLRLVDGPVWDPILRPYGPSGARQDPRAARRPASGTVWLIIVLFAL